MDDIKFLFCDVVIVKYIKYTLPIYNVRERLFFFLQASINLLGSHNCVLHYVLLTGDSGYALRPWMMTPVVGDVENAAVERYNSRQKSTRALIERCNGLLKMRFRCLLKHRVLHYKPDVCSKIVNACTVLHNMCIQDNVPLPNEQEDEVLDFGLLNNMNEGQIEIVQRNVELTAGRRVRNEIITRYFSQ